MKLIPPYSHVIAHAFIGGVVQSWPFNYICFLIGIEWCFDVTPLWPNLVCIKKWLHFIFSSFFPSFPHLGKLEFMDLKLLGAKLKMLPPSWAFYTLIELFRSFNAGNSMQEIWGLYLKGCKVIYRPSKLDFWKNFVFV